MASWRHLPYAGGDYSHSTRHSARHHVLIWLLMSALLIAAASAIAFAHAQMADVASNTAAGVAEVRSAQTQPADRFIRSVITEDGALGWHQLCPDMQARLPLDTLVQQADAMRVAATKEGAWLTAESLSTHAQQGGWHVHVYRMTAHWPTGATRQWTYNVLTQPSGCVEDVQTGDVQAH